MNSIRDITPIDQSPPYSRPSELFPVHYFQYRKLSHPASFFLRCDFVVEQKTAYLFDDESSLSFADSISRISSHSRPCLKVIFKFRDNFFGKVNFADFSEAQQKLICQQVLAVRTMTSEDDMSVASSVTTPSELTSTGDAEKPCKQSRSALFCCNDGTGNSTGQMILVIDVSVLASGTSMLPGLPVPINTLFPHIALELGLEIGGASNPLLMSVIDTAAALTTGNFYYVAKIAKAFPHCLAKIFLPKDYSPVILSGIVQKDGESVTTALQVAFLFHLPYLSREGEPTSLMIATGTHVTVNLILGLPFITSTGMIIDTTDQVAELRALDSPTFPIEYRRATVHVPLIDESAVPVNYSNYRDIIAEVDQLEEYMMAQSATKASEASRPRQVTFGAATTTSHGGRQTVSVDMAIDELVAIPACPIIGGRTMNDSIDKNHDPTLGIHSADIV